MSIEHVILDRDGVLNREPETGDFVRNVGDFHWMPGALEGLATLRQAKIRVSVATNQSGVGRGLMSAEALAAIHRSMCETALAAGAQIDEVFCCTHSPEMGCDCRKPAPGLIREAIGRSSIKAQSTIVLGDARRDLEAGWRSGTQVALLRTGKGAQTESEIRGLGVPVYDDLCAFARSVVRGGADRETASAIDLQRIFAEHADVLAASRDQLAPAILDIVAILFCTLQSGRKVYACGNGGSAADAQHLVAELVGRFQGPRRALPAIVLGADPASLTAIGNDFGFEHIFARPLEALATRGDLLFAFSTSGNSANVIQAAHSARKAGCTVVAVTGGNGGKLASLSDRVMCVPSFVVARIQEMHTLIIHTVCESLDALIVQSNAP